MKWVRQLIVIGVIGVVSRDARADDVDTPPDKPAPAPKRFGQDGQVVFDELLGFGVQGIGTPNGGALVTGWLRYESSKSESQGMTSQVTTIAFAPSFDVFVGPRLSLGGQVTAFHSQSRSQFTSTILGGGLRPRIGWVFPVTDDLAFWPRAFASISYSHAKSESPASGVGTLGAVGGVGGLNGGGQASQGAVAWGLGVDAIMAASVSKTVALTFGPTISYGKLDASSGTGPFMVAAATRTTISAAVHGGIALVF